MAQKYYNTAETAKNLGKSVDEVKKMLERRELHGYRDGADWKFKVEDIDQLAKQSPRPAARRGGRQRRVVERSRVGPIRSRIVGHGDRIKRRRPARPDSDIRVADSDM